MPVATASRKSMTCLNACCRREPTRTPPTVEEYADHLLDTSLRAHGFASPKHVTYGRPGTAIRRGLARAARRRCGRRESRQDRCISTPPISRGRSCSIGAVRARPRASAYCRRSTIRLSSASATSRYTTTTTSSSAMCRPRNDASAIFVCRSCIAMLSSAASIAKRSAPSDASTSCICTSSATSPIGIASSPHSPRRRANSQRSTTATTSCWSRPHRNAGAADVRKALAAGV